MLHQRSIAIGYGFSLLLALVVAANIATAADAQRSLALSSCDIPGLTKPARCGELSVPENPDRPAGRKLSIGVAVVPAASGRALPDPIVLLMGGPGEEAISAAGFFAGQFASVLDHRDFLLVDQRGTGRSSTLRCDLYSADDPAASLRDFFPLTTVEKCALQLRERADLTQYSFAHFANDLEEVRRALGYGPMNLTAGSYGTRAAQVYMRMYPKSVRTANLNSIVPIDIASPLPMAQEAQAALDNTLGACEAEPACRAAFPNVRNELRQVLTRLESGSVRVPVPGHQGIAPMNRGRVVEWFRSLLYRPSTAANVPWLIHRAYEGDWRPILEGILAQARGIDTGVSVGLFFSITCGEDVPFMGEEEIQSKTRGTYLGDYRVRQQQAACKHWPSAQLPEDYRKPVRSAVPTLFVSGDTDGGSPLWFTEHAAAGFSDRVEIVLGGRGHTEWADCLGPLYERLVRTGSTKGIDPSTCKSIPRPPFKIH